MRTSYTNGIGGVLALLGAVCPVCIPAIASVLASAGILIFVSAIIKPMFLIMLGVFWFGLWWSYRRHHNALPLIAAIIAGSAAYWMRYEWFIRVSVIDRLAWYDWRVIAPSLALIVIAYWNYRLDKKNGTCSVPKYICPECGLSYRDAETAKKCAAWCAENHSCNLEITKNAIK